MWVLILSSSSSRNTKNCTDNIDRSIHENVKLAQFCDRKSNNRAKWQIHYEYIAELSYVQVTFQIIQKHF